MKESRTLSCNVSFPRVYGSLEERFYAKIAYEPMSGCWIWTGDCNGVNGSYGYGSIGIYEGGKQKRVYAHRISIELSGIEIPAGMEVDHVCRNKLCVNPGHLRIVSHLENIRSIPKEIRGGFKKKELCKRGHGLSGDNIRIDKRGYPVCRTCARMHDRMHYAKTKKNIPV